MTDVLWQPTPDSMRETRIAAFAEWVAQRRGISVGDPVDYDALWRWSVEHLDEFWAEVWKFFDVAPGTTYDAVLADRSMPGAVWFPGARLNYAEHVLRRGEGRGRRDVPAHPNPLWHNP